jgi:hypothetical protein
LKKFMSVRTHNTADGEYIFFGEFSILSEVIPLVRA